MILESPKSPGSTLATTFDRAVCTVVNIKQPRLWLRAYFLDTAGFTPMTSESHESRGLISENYSFHDIYLKVERGDEWSLEKSSLQEFWGHHVTIHFLKICMDNYLKKGRRLKQTWKDEDRMFSKDIISWSLVIFFFT